MVPKSRVCIIIIIIIIISPSPLPISGRPACTAERMAEPGVAPQMYGEVEFCVSKKVCMCVCPYVHIYLYTCIYNHLYTHTSNTISTELQRLYYAPTCRRHFSQCASLTCKGHFHKTWLTSETLLKHKVWKRGLKQGLGEFHLFSGIWSLHQRVQNTTSHNKPIHPGLCRKPPFPHHFIHSSCCGQKTGTTGGFSLCCLGLFLFVLGKSEQEWGISR